MNEKIKAKVLEIDDASIQKEPHNCYPLMSVPIDQADIIGLMYAARTSTQLCGPLHSNYYSVRFDGG